MVAFQYVDQSLCLEIMPGGKPGENPREEASIHRDSNKTGEK